MTNNLIRQSFVYAHLNDQTVLFLEIQFNISHLFAHNLDGQTVLFDPSGATTSTQSEPGSNGNKRVLHTPQSSRTRASPQDTRWEGLTLL